LSRFVGGRAAGGGGGGGPPRRWCRRGTGGGGKLRRWRRGRGLRDHASCASCHDREQHGHLEGTSAGTPHLVSFHASRPAGFAGYGLAQARTPSALITILPGMPISPAETNIPPSPGRGFTLIQPSSGPPLAGKRKVTFTVAPAGTTFGV